MAGQPVDCRNPGVNELVALADSHTSDQQQIVASTQLLGAQGTAEARAHAFVFPTHRDTGGVVIVKQALQLHALGTVDRNQIADPIPHDRPIAQSQLGLWRHRHAHLGKRVGVGGQLQQCGGLGRPGQLGVGDPVFVAVSNQEVGEPDEPAVEHCGLVDHGGALGDGALGGVGGGRQPGERVCGTADHCDLVAELVAQPVEFAPFVLVAERGRSRDQFVFRGDGGSPAELGVEGTEQGVFALGGGREIRCAVDDALAGDEHSSDCRRGVRRGRSFRACVRSVAPALSCPDKSILSGNFRR